MSLDVYAGFLLATILIVIIPGPMVTLVIANSLTHGMRAGILNVLGGQVGLAISIALVALGLSSVIESMGWWFEWVRLAGAAYLVWLGWKLIRSSGDLKAAANPRVPRGGFLLQGSLVMLSNPKTLFFFGAFLPQFLDPTRDFYQQILIMGLTAMVIALVSDGFYAVAVGRARSLLTQRRVRFVNRAGGACLIGGGLWLAFSRSR